MNKNKNINKKNCNNKTEFQNLKFKYLILISKFNTIIP